MSESTNQRVSESASQRVGESTNQRVSESASQRVSESTSQRVGESASQQGLLRLVRIIKHAVEQKSADGLHLGKCDAFTLKASRLTSHASLCEFCATAKIPGFLED
ncbi:MAG: hypothetical protein ABIG63_01440 [Chloroflexota bacterium]